MVTNKYKFFVVVLFLWVKMGRTTKTRNVSFDPDVYVWLLEMSKESGIPIATLINSILKYARKKGWKVGVFETHTNTQ